MSFVGLRSLLNKYLPLFTQEHARRHKVLPGITGWAHFNDSNANIWVYNYVLKLWYPNHRSLWLVLRALWQMVHKLILRADISAAGKVTMHKFTGSES